MLFGAAKKTTIVTVEVPVFRDGEVIYDISFSPPLSMFQNILEKQRPNADWTLSMLDSDGVVFARAPNPDNNIGKRASESARSLPPPGLRSSRYASSSPHGACRNL